MQTSNVFLLMLLYAWEWVKTAYIPCRPGNKTTTQTILNSEFQRVSMYSKEFMV